MCSFLLWLKATESEVKANYERDKTPDPLQYYVKDYAYYSSLHYPEWNARDRVTY